MSGVKLTMKGLSWGLAFYSIFILNVSFAFDILVTTTADVVADDNACSLHEAILTANTNTNSGDLPNECQGTGVAGTADEILLPNGFYQLSQSLPVITEEIKIVGSSTGQTIIDASGGGRVFFVQLDSPLGGAITQIFDLTVAGSRFNAALAIVNGEQVQLIRTQWLNNQAGAVQIFSGGLSVVNSTFRGNRSGASGAAIRVELNAGIMVNSSTFEDNHSGESGGAVSAIGGSAEARAIMNIFESTFVDNGADNNGGAINYSNATGQIVSTTISGNTTDEDQDNSGRGGGIYVGENSMVSLLSSIVAKNIDASNSLNVVTTRPDLGTAQNDSSVLSSSGYNLIGNNIGVLDEFPASASKDSHNINNDIVGAFFTPVDPLLGVLRDNGGITKTMLPILTANQISPAIDKGACILFATDQRVYSFLDGDDGPGKPAQEGDFPRQIDHPEISELGISNCDIGAVERALLDDSLCVSIKAQNQGVIAFCL